MLHIARGGNGCAKRSRRAPHPGCASQCLPELRSGEPADLKRLGRRPLRAPRMGLPCVAPRGGPSLAPRRAGWTRPLSRLLMYLALRRCMMAEGPRGRARGSPCGGAPRAGAGPYREQTQTTGCPIAEMLPTPAPTATRRRLLRGSEFARAGALRQGAEAAPVTERVAATRLGSMAHQQTSPRHDH